MEELREILSELLIDNGSPAGKEGRLSKVSEIGHMPLIQLMPLNYPEFLEVIRHIQPKGFEFIGRKLSGEIASVALHNPLMSW